MDARDLVFLRGHIDPDASRFEVMGSYVGISNGALRGPSQRCTYIASAPCSQDLVVGKGTFCKLELDMTVPELADLDLDMSDLNDRDDELVDFWIDDEVGAAWDDMQPARPQLVDAGPPATPAGPGLAPPGKAKKLGPRVDAPELAIRRGSCYLVAEITASNNERMGKIVAFVTALAGAPIRRAAELAAAFAGHDPRVPARVRLDGDGAVALVRGLEIEACYRREAATDCRSRAIRAVVRSPVGAAPLVVVDPELPKKLRPKDHGKLVEHGPWIADAPIPERVAASLAAARPSALVATSSEVLATFAGPVVERERLVAAVELVGAIAGDAGGAPYR